MSNTTANLVDHVIAADLPLRQCVLTVPFELRLLLATKPEALAAMGRIFVQEVQRWQRQQARALGYEGAETAAVSFCQRFGSSLSLNIHWHVIVPDAFFVPDASGERYVPVSLDSYREVLTTIMPPDVADIRARWCGGYPLRRCPGAPHAPAFHLPVALLKQR